MKNSLEQNNEFITYLASCANREQGRIPSLVDLSRELGISVATLREQMEVARALGLVEVKPRTGIRYTEFSFRPAVLRSLNYAIATRPNSFEEYSDLRNHIETAYWYQAVSLLTLDDHEKLRGLVRQASVKLSRTPVQIPHQEHRELHLSIYRRLNNVFVTGILEAYWDLYEAAGLDVYTDIIYLRRVWQYHDKMVEQIIAGNYEAGYQAMIDHINLLTQRPKSVSHQKFE